MSMFSSTVDLLDRQLAHLDDLPHVEFLLAVVPFLDALDADVQLAAHLIDLEQEADDIGCSLCVAERDNGVPSRTLARIWEDLGQGLTGPQLGNLVQARPRFERLLGDVHHPIVVPLDAAVVVVDPSRIGQLVEMIDALDVSAGALTIDPSRTMLEDVKARQKRVHGQILRTTRIHPGVALLRLRCLASIARGESEAAPVPVAEASSRPREVSAQPALVVRADVAGQQRVALLDEILRGVTDIEDHAVAPALIRGLRVAVKRVGMELRARIGTTRSRLVTIDRFKARAEWHDRERLFALAAEATGGRERVLRDELALYLFDQGLNPLPEVPLGPARADLLDFDSRSSFVLEAKQYGDRTSISGALKAAFRQAVDTAALLSGSGYGIEEAFVVLFRRGGPRAALPVEPIMLEGIRWYLRLIDIAPAAETASRSRDAPVEYAAEELNALLVDAYTAVREDTG